MRFSEIPGHEDVKERLVQMVDNDRIPHALLFEGPNGSGKFALARALAQYIHCTNRTPDGDSCGQCPACKQHESFNHIDTIFTFPVVKKDGKGFSDTFLPEFRELLNESIYMNFDSWLEKLDNVNAQPMIYVEEANELNRRLCFSAHGSKYKIVLMWLPERLREDAANKLLKLIEEPFEDTLFILTSDNSRAILPTIFSRTQRISVKRYSNPEIAQILEREFSILPEDASDISRLALGNMNTAIDMISISKESNLFLDLFMELMRKAYGRKVADLKKWASDVAELGREREMKFLEYAARLIRENFILNLASPQLNYLTKAEMQFCRNFSPFINEKNVLQIFDVINKARTDVAANANAKLVNFDVALSIILLLKR